MHAAGSFNMDMKNAFCNGFLMARSTILCSFNDLMFTVACVQPFMLKFKKKNKIDRKCCENLINLNRSRFEKLILEINVCAGLRAWAREFNLYRVVKSIL